MSIEWKREWVSEWTSEMESEWERAREMFIWPYIPDQSSSHSHKKRSKLIRKQLAIVDWLPLTNKFVNLCSTFSILVLTLFFLFVSLVSFYSEIILLLSQMGCYQWKTVKRRGGGGERQKYLTCIYKETYNFFYTPPLSLHPSFFYCYCRRRRRRRFSEISNVQISFCVWKKMYMYIIYDSSLFDCFHLKCLFD